MQELLAESEGIHLKIEDIDLEDKETLALFAAGNTKGIFQFEQPGAIRLLKRVQPQVFEEVVATTSLNRPGASDYIDNFVARKHGKEKVTVLDPVLEDILSSTYGIMLYQEQVMQVAQRFGGFSLGKAGIFSDEPWVRKCQRDAFDEGRFYLRSYEIGAYRRKGQTSFCSDGKVCRLWI